MAIEWTNNSTDNLNLWNRNDTATWTVTDNGDSETGVIPEWIRTEDFDDKPQFYFANARERMMMVDQGVDTPGDVYRGESGEVSYDATTNTLTISEPLGMELNNWTVQVTQIDGGGVFRWPGWGGMTVSWSDPGCHAWDRNTGDQTHLIMRTFELSGEDGLTDQQELDADQSGVWRVSYSIDGPGDTITRDVNLPGADPSTNFDAPLEPQDPVPGARAHFSGTVMWSTTNTNTITRIFVAGRGSDFVGIGDYPDNTQAFATAHAGSFDGMAIDAGVRCIIYSAKNFQGEVLADVTGPVVMNNSLLNNQYYGETLDSDWSDVAEDPQQPGVTLTSIFPRENRVWSETNMQTWGEGSMKLRQVP